IPNVIKAALDPTLGPVKIFGDDYDTPDGTCIRDYIHVADLCDAHLRALVYMDTFAGCRAFNLGTGSGNSVADVLTVSRNLFGGRPVSETPARGRGVPATLLASPARARADLGWEPKLGLSACIKSAATWHREAAIEPR